jgi:hypothetical protein
MNEIIEVGERAAEIALSENRSPGDLNDANSQGKYWRLIHNQLLCCSDE